MFAKLLVVDDDEIILTITQDDLESCGYDVTTAEDGAIAWEMIDRDPARFDLILLDKVMPKLDGIALLKRIRADKRFNHLPVVMMTADSQPENIAEGLAAGAFYYLTKPSTPQVLALVIKNTLDEFRQKRELSDLLGQRNNNLNLLRNAEFVCRTLADSRDLALLLATVSGDPDRTVNGYSELLINAVEHGNLNITYAEKSQLLRDDRWEEEIEARLKNPLFAGRQVQVLIQKTADEMIVTISDQGEGFDWHRYMEFSPDRAFDLHGRGIAMAKATNFDQVEYLGKGNSVKVKVHLPSEKIE